MKYIKTFENVNRYFKLITTDEFIDIMESDSPIRCSTTLIKYLNHLNIFGTEKPGGLRGTHSYYSISGFIQNFVIIELKDEWFIVIIIDRDKFNDSYYKCDQLEGLGKCIEESMIMYSQ